MAPPPWARIIGTTAFEQIKSEDRLTSMMRRHSSTPTSSMSRWWAMIAALLWRKSTRPNAVSVLPTRSWTWGTSVTSADAKMASPPASAIMRTVSSPSASFRSTAATFAPRSAKSNAEARPMPPAAPVTMATLPSTRFIAGLYRRPYRWRSAPAGLRPGGTRSFPRRRAAPP